MRVETVTGQNFQRVGLHSNFLRLPRERVIKLVIEPPGTVALVLSFFKTVVGQACQESDCTVTDCSSHVKRVLIELNTLKTWLVRPANGS